MDRLRLNESEEAIAVSGEDFSLVVGRASGALESLELGSRELIAKPLVPNFWRVPLDNDIGFLLMNDMPGRLGVWKTAGPGRSVTSVRAERLAPQAVRVVAEALRAFPQLNSSLDLAAG